MWRPPDQKKRRAAPVQEAAQQKFEGLVSKFEPAKPTRNQAVAQAHVARPIAVAEPIGSNCHTLRIHHIGGAIEHRGLFSSEENALTAAREMNRLFERERGAS